MPAILAFLSALGAVIVPLAIRVMVGLGFAAVVYTGVGAAWDWFGTNIASTLGAVSASVVSILAMARVDDAIQIVLSAGSAKLALRGLTAAGALKRVVWGGV